MSNEPRETFRLVMTRVVGAEPTEVAFFLNDRDDNHLHSGSMLFSDIRTNFKAAFNMSDQSLAAMESNVRNRKEIDHLLQNETYSSLRVAGLLPPLHVAPKVDIEIHVNAQRR